MAKQSSPVRDRVNILYKDHETAEEQELPLKLLVIGDFAGHEDDEPLDERKPIEVNQRSLGAVMAEQKVRARFNCPSKLSREEGVTIPVDLAFHSYADFGPEWVAQSIPELRAIVETRAALSELKGWLRSSESLVLRLQQALAKPKNRNRLRRELGLLGEVPLSEEELIEWVVAGSGVETGEADYPSLRRAVERYLQTRLGEFNDPAELQDRALGPEPSALDSAASEGPGPDLPSLDSGSLGASALGPSSAPASAAPSLGELLERPDLVDDRQQLERGMELSPDQLLVDGVGVDIIIAELDHLLAAQLDAVLHHPSFQAVESAWRSLRYMLANVNFRENTRVYLLNCNKQDLIDDFEDAPEVSKSGLYRIIYAVEYGTFGGEPYGLVVADYDFDPGPRDMTLMANCASVAAMAHVPFIANASARFFGEKSFEGLATYNDIRAIFQTPLYTRWNSFRDTEDARYFALCLPRFLLREPWGHQSVSSFNYAERSATKADFLWGRASFAFATRVADSFARYRWCPNIVGPTAGGGVENLPMLPFRSMRRLYDFEDDPKLRRGIEERMPTEIHLTERHEFELAEEGFIGLVFLKGDAKACFFSANSAQRPKSFPNTEEGRGAALGARLGAQLPYVLIVCRIAHYLKVLQREEIGRHLERSDLERELNNWLKDYVSDMENPAPAVRGKRPLRQATIKVEEVAGQAGWYRAHLMLRPHLKYMGASFTLSLVGKLERES